MCSRRRAAAVISTAAAAALLMTASTSAEHLMGRPKASSPINIGIMSAAAAAAGRRRRIPPIPNLMARSTMAVRQASLHAHVVSKTALEEAADDVACGLAVTSSSSAVAAASSVKTKKRRRRRRYNNSGFYYGIREDLMVPFLGGDDEGNDDSDGTRVNAKLLDQQEQDKDTTTGIPRLLLGGTPGTDGKARRLPGGGTKRRRPIRRNSATLTEIMGETLLELREMREEIFALREEMRIMKQQMWTAENGDADVDEFEDDESQQSLLAEEAENVHMPEHHDHPQPHGIGGLMARRKRHRMWEKIGHDVEKWADKLLFEETCQRDENGEGSGWREVKCARVVRKKYNKEGRFKCYLKWMPDSRAENANDDDEGRESPCICMKGTIDAPFEHVCGYLSRKEYMHEYNELVCAHRDLEEITPHSKITWGQCPQILFVKPRDFVTYCHHRWRRDGTLVIVNQACEHEDAPGVDTDKGGKVCRAFALRGANYISKDPDDETKTRFYLLAHADPGGGLPQWACKSAVNAVAPIEPFKLFQNIEDGVRNKGAPPPRAAGFAAALPGRSSRPAGVSQMGYACFWPEGGGLKDHHHTEHQERGEPSSEENSVQQAHGGTGSNELMNRDVPN